MEQDEMWLEPDADVTDLFSLWYYALTVNGYRYAPAHLGVDCGDLANQRLDVYRQTGKWAGTFPELRCCLFFEQRRWRHFGEDPEGKELTALQDLYRALQERWREESPRQL